MNYKRKLIYLVKDSSGVPIRIFGIKKEAEDFYSSVVKSSKDLVIDEWDVEFESEETCDNCGVVDGKYPCQHNLKGKSCGMWEPRTAEEE